MDISKSKNWKYLNLNELLLFISVHLMNIKIKLKIIYNIIYFGINNLNKKCLKINKF